MKEVRIFDDLLPSELYERILNDMNQPRWAFTGGGGNNKFWHIDGLESDPFYSMDLFNIIKQKTGIDGYTVKRVYANGQTACQSGNPHYDDGDLTFLYYPTKELSVVDGGHLIFSNSIKPEPAGEAVYVVSYKHNRGVMFPANICHYAEAPNRNFAGLRVSIAWKLRKR